GLLSDLYWRVHPVLLPWLPFRGGALSHLEEPRVKSSRASTGSLGRVGVAHRRPPGILTPSHSALLTQGGVMKAIWVPVFTALVAVLPVTDCRAAAPA